MDLPLGGEEHEAPPETVLDDGEEIDLGELEAALAQTGEPPAAAEDSGAPGDDRFSLELDSEDGGDDGMPAAPHAETAEGPEDSRDIDDQGDDLGDLSLELEGETGAETGSVASAGNAVESKEEIDLSDIEALLESDRGFAATAEPEFTEETDDGEEGIDISEIEEVLAVSPEGEEDEAPGEAVEDLDLDFDIGEEPVTEESAQETFFAEDAADFEFEEDDIEIAEAPAEEAVSPAGEEPEVAPDDSGDDGALETVGAFVDSSAAESPATRQPAAAAVAAAGTAVASAAAARSARRGGGRLLLWIVVILLLVIGGYVAYSYYPGKNIAGIPKLGDLDIPYVSPLFQTRHQVDPGNLKIRTIDVTSRFVDNAKAGRLFVISGKVTNRYPEPRRAIKIVGRLYVKGKKLIQTQTVMGGIVVSDLELSRLDAGQISKRLSGRGPVLKPGKSLPFMIVFSKLPDNLEEFTIEVVSSRK